MNLDNLSAGEYIVTVTDQNSYSADTLNGVAAGSYHLGVTGGNGCIEQTMIIVNSPDPIQVSYQTDAAKCNGEATGAIEIILRRMMRTRAGMTCSKARKCQLAYTSTLLKSPISMVEQVL